MKLKTFLILLGSIIAILLFIDNGLAATNWVGDLTLCPGNDQTNFPGQFCEPQVICGDNSGTVQCTDNTSIGTPATTLSTTDVDSDSQTAGFRLNCYDTADGSDPQCSDSVACDRNDTLFNSPIYRQTNCTGFFGANIQGLCRSSRFNCYGDTNCESTSSTDCGGVSSNTHYITASCEVDPFTVGSGTCECDSGFFECDGSIVDGDGCEFQNDASCGSSTGYYELDECVSGSAANCTAQNSRVNNRDCDNSDGDGYETTCNSGNGCEITLFSDTNNSRSIYQTCTTFACQSGWLDCNPDGDPTDTGMNPDGCETQEGLSCGNSTGTFASNQCYTTTGNCTRSTDHLDCDNDDSDSDQLTCNGPSGCEVDPGSACTVGGLPGTVADACPFTCNVDNQDIATTGINVTWSGTNPMLWLLQLGTGASILTNHSNGNLFIVNSSGAFYNGFDLSTDTGGGGGGSGKSGSNPELYNDTDTIYLNLTTQNKTTNASIDSRVDNGFLTAILNTIYLSISYFDQFLNTTNDVVFNTMNATTFFGNISSTYVNDPATLCPGNTFMQGFPGDNLSTTQCATPLDTNDTTSVEAHESYIVNQSAVDCADGNHTFGNHLNGTRKCRDDVAGGGGGTADSLGNHTATQILNMSDFNITNNNIQFWDEGLLIGIMKNESNLVIGNLTGWI